MLPAPSAGNGAGWTVLDEPTEGLAPLAVEDMMVNNIQLLHEDNLTVFLVEQNVPMALKVATCSTILVCGGMVYDGVPDKDAAI